MKKFISCLTLVALMGSMRAETEEVTTCEEQNVVRTEAVEVQEEATRQITADEEAACRRIMEQLRNRYAELNLHTDIETALQEVADANRDDFDIAKHVLGVQLEDGSWVWPIESRFLVK